MTALALAAALLAAPARSHAASPPSPASTQAPKAVSTADRAKALLLADLLLGRRRFEEAEEVIVRWQARDPESAPWVLREARLRAEQGRHEESAALYRRLLESNPDDAGLKLQVALQSFARGDVAGARTMLLEVRQKVKGHQAPYYLSEAESALGNEAKARDWAREALAALPEDSRPETARTRLRLRAKLAFDDGLDREFLKLYEKTPKSPEPLFDWVSALTRWELVDAADEPLALLEERFPAHEARVRRLRADFLRRRGDDRALSAHLEASLARFPDDAGFGYMLGERDWAMKRWEAARARFEAARPDERYRRPADEMLEELHRQHDHHAGPEAVFKQSEGTRVFGQGLRYHGYARRRVRVEAAAVRADYRRRRGGGGTALSGLWASVAREAPRWVLGADADLMTGPALTAVSPGAFGDWRPCEGCSVEGAAGLRRAWTQASEGPAAGAKTDFVEGRGAYRPVKRVELALQGRLDRLTVSNGGSATHTLLQPEAVLVLAQRAFYGALGYRFAAGGAAGDARFFSQLPLLGRFRTHYLSLSASRHWAGRKLRAGAYVYNGHDAARGRRFGRADLVGGGLDVDKQLGPFQALLSYSYSLDDEKGIGGKSHTLKAGLMVRWERREKPRGER